MSKCTCFSNPLLETDFLEKFRIGFCHCNNNTRLYAEENGRKFSIIVHGDRYDYQFIYKIKVDGFLIKDNVQSRCDYFFKYVEGHEVKNNIFVELKGKNIDKAYDQINQTIKVFKNNHVIKDDSVVNGVIVSSRVPNNGGRDRELKEEFRRKQKGRLEIKTNQTVYDVLRDRVI